MTEPIPLLLICPTCHTRHIDEGEFATRVHHTHACQHCGTVWRPAIVPTVGVRFLPGFKNETAPRSDDSIPSRVLEILRVDGKPLTAIDVGKRMSSPVPGLNVIRTALSKLLAKGEVERPSHGVYRATSGEL